MLILDYKFKNKELLAQALTHKSFVTQVQDVSKYNERLEFLGDAVIDLIIAEHLFKLHPLDHEGDLSKKRSTLVREGVLANIARTLGLQESIQLGNGELKTGGKNRDRLMASTFEALVGAVFMDSDYATTQKVIVNLFNQFLEKNVEIQNVDFDYKSQLQELVQKEYKETPLYKLKSESGFSHEKIFCMEVYIKNQLYGEGTGPSKKKAEQEAAWKGLERMKIEIQTAKASEAGRSSNV